MLFDDSTMSRHPISATSSSTVTLMISPALIKRGDSRGEDFNPNKVVCPSEVITGHSKSLMTQKHNDHEVETRTLSRATTWAASTSRGTNMTVATIHEKEQITTTNTLKSRNPIKKLVPRIARLKKRLSCCW
ncbi:hypothetical protein B0T21DRAFT_371996 [Apiosordaria backusii]|uniref:Uncharacterized protein n=1 Tax=Apiosordaria backusii TaxID=314023 RepID=A0AA40E7A2_9PEZI|nr:hypothetical protein B0T21DRAFT_371996 [Apiosordaria backusii]